jgi:hypothetical protein
MVRRINYKLITQQAHVAFSLSSQYISNKVVILEQEAKFHTHRKWQFILNDMLLCIFSNRQKNQCQLKIYLILFFKSWQ